MLDVGIYLFNHGFITELHWDFINNIHRGYLESYRELEHTLSHHEEHEGHEVNKEHIDILSSCPSCASWL